MEKREGKYNYFWKLSFLWNRMQRKIKECEKLEIVYILSEVNGEVDILLKLVFYCKESWVKWED